jgi:hypothetical protein
LFAAGAGFAQSASSSPTASPSETVSPAVSSETLAHVQPPVEGYHFPNGQTLIYQVEWRVFNAGTASLRMEQAGQEQRVVMTADTSGSIAAVFHLRDRIESFVNPTDFCSLNLSKQTEEGFRRNSMTLQFDYARHKSVLDQVNLKKHETRHEEHDIPDCVVDVVSSFYYVASQKLEPGVTFLFPLNDGGKTQNVKIHVEKREKLKVPAGSFDTIRIYPEAEDGTLHKKGKAMVWFSDDARHIPVQMEAKSFLGTVSIKLLRIEQK